METLLSVGKLGFVRTVLSTGTGAAKVFALGKKAVLLAQLGRAEGRF